jgi:hypothetical protein
MGHVKCSRAKPLHDDRRKAGQADRAPRGIDSNCGDHRLHAAGQRKEFAKNERRFAENEKRFEKLTDLFGGLLGIVKQHEIRLNNLDRPLS